MRNAIALLLCLAPVGAVLPEPASAQVSIGVSVNIGPPPLPIYVQPPLPGPDFLWAPGYWAWDDYAEAYFWVPGTWARAPRPGMLWTPPWWGWQDGAYLFHGGYWGPHIGFYGGIAYGFGYTGIGYQGGYWNGGHVFYNRTVNNVTNVNVTNIYNQTIINRTTRVSYNGGPAGVRALPTPQERAFGKEQHIAPTGNQQQHFAAARSDPRAFYSANRGVPPIAATQRTIPAMGAPGDNRYVHAVAAAPNGRPMGGAPSSTPPQRNGYYGSPPAAPRAFGAMPPPNGGAPVPRVVENSAEGHSYNANIDQRQPEAFQQRAPQNRQIFNPSRPTNRNGAPPPDGFRQSPDPRPYATGAGGNRPAQPAHQNRQPPRPMQGRPPAPPRPRPQPKPHQQPHHDEHHGPNG